MGSLQALEAEYADLVRQRRGVITLAEAMIASANESFDRLAVPMAREIETRRIVALDAVSKAAFAPAPEPRKATTIDRGHGYSQEDIDHYNRLRGLSQ